MGENELSKEDVDTLFDKPEGEGEAAAPAEGAAADEAAGEGAAPAEGATPDEAAAPAEGAAEEAAAASAERETATAVAESPDGGEGQPAPPLTLNGDSHGERQVASGDQRGGGTTGPVHENSGAKDHGMGSYRLSGCPMADGSTSSDRAYWLPWSQ